MTQEQKRILLIDLCARLPYKICARQYYSAFEDDFVIEGIIGEQIYARYNLRISMTYPVEKIKPYLRSLSSMTEDEFQDLKSYSGLIYDQLELQEFYDNSKCLEFYLSEIPSYVVILVFDWLIKNHFDFRGLIRMGLALEAPKEMYRTYVL